MKLTFDVDRDDGALADAARDERAAIVATQQRAGVVSAIVALALLVVLALPAAWLDDRWRLTGGERLALRILLVVAALVLLAALALALAAAWPIARRRLDELLERNGDAQPANPGRARALAVEAVERAQALRARRGARLRWALGLVGLGLLAVAGQAILFALVAGGAPREDEDDRPPEMDAVAELAADHAPLIGLHDRERYGPLDPALFLRGAALRWARRGEDDVVVRAGRLRPGRIGAECAARCITYGPYLPFQLTRPYRAGRHRPDRLGRRTGFYLDGDALVRPGQLVPDPPVPIFYDARPADGTAPLSITYWAFFPFRRPLRNRPPARGHEGDWQSVTIAFDEKRKPESVTLARRGPPRTVDWSEVKTIAGTHPRLYATAQSHELATRPSRGGRRGEPCVRVRGRRRCALLLRDDDLAWRPWGADRVLPLRAQPWYGFGGAWGRAGRTGRTTGPLGPSRYRPGPLPPEA